MRDVPADTQTIGEVIMRGNNTMKGYYRDPEATERAFAGGWFHTGDLAVMHPDGYIELRDRKKDIIISGGENISTIEVEQAISAHPAVLEAAVIAIPESYWARSAEGIRYAQTGPGRHRGRAARLRAASAWLASKFRRRSSSATCRRHPPAKCRNSCSANGSGPGKKNGSIRPVRGTSNWKFGKTVLDCRIKPSPLPPPRGHPARAQGEGDR